MFTIPGGEPQINRRVVDECIRVLRSYGVIAIPTDTIYGIMARVQSSKAVESLYKIKVGQH